MNKKRTFYTINLCYKLKQEIYTLKNLTPKALSN